MDLLLKVAVFLSLIGYLNASDYGHCEQVVKDWARSSLEQEEVKGDKHELQDLLFFLHVPRTGGRTYFHCLLKRLYSSSLECPRSYDKLRFDPRHSKCRLLVTHDDYSMMSKLPKDKTSVVTILRNPIDRVFSTYEFSVEVAARFLVHPNLTSATNMARRLRSKTKGVSTLDIWPWKYLVPWMREDLFSRRDARIMKDLKYVNINDSYNVKDVVMPLEEYINKPIAWDIIHNGATFQVAGLTNNSYLSDSYEVRHCVQKFKSLGDYVLQVAKKRLDNMLYVGLTENHRESAKMFGNVVGAQVISQMEGTNSSMFGSSADKSEKSPSLAYSEPDISYHQNGTFEQKSGVDSSAENAETTEKNMTVGKLMESYEGCISSLRKSQTQRRINSLKKISPANFSKEARLQVPQVVLEQIRSYNNLDMELYKYAQAIFAKQSEHMKQKFVTAEPLEGYFNDSDGTSIWRVTLLAVSIVICVFFFLIINARRRTSKVKI